MWGCVPTPLLCHAWAVPSLLCHAWAASLLLVVVPRPPPSLASCLLTTEDALRQLRACRRKDARANTRVATVGDEAVALHTRLSEAEAKAAVLRARVEQMEREATNRNELWMRTKKQIFLGRLVWMRIC
jgi:septal ring factor EnvC (AmiA/AmiB activator)